MNMPKELRLWRQHTELKEQVADAEARIADHRENLNQLFNKNSSKCKPKQIIFFNYLLRVAHTHCSTHTGKA